MTFSSLIGLVNNSALLVALVLIYDMLGDKLSADKPNIQQFLTGIIIGTIGLTIMNTPWEFKPGVIFDTRSVLLCISGLFFGFVPTVVAMVMTGVLRLYMGGAGAVTGLAVIITSGATGLAWRYFRNKNENDLTVIDLYLLGFTVHVAMLLWMFLLPYSVAIKVLSKISIPVIVIYPVTTALVGWMILSRSKRKQAEEALLESEKRFSLAMEASKDGLWDWNIVTNDAYYSPGYTAMLGYSSSELPSHLHTWANLIHPDDKNKALRANMDCVENLSSDFAIEFRMKHKTGEWRWILGRGKVIDRDSEGRAMRMVGTNTDITESKQADAKLMESEALLSQMFEQSMNSLGLFDTDGTIIRVNNEFCKMFGVEEEVILNSGYNLFADKAIADAGIFPLLKSILEEKTIKKWEIDFDIDVASESTGMPTSKSGKLFLEVHGYPVLDSSGDLECVVLQHYNITEQKKAENVIAKFFEQPMNIHMIAGFDSTIQRVNTGWEKILGYTKDEIEGSSFMDLVHPDDVADTIKEMENLEKGITTLFFENRYLHKDGSFRLLEWSAIATLEDQMIHAVASDITDLRRSEKQLKDNQKFLDSIIDQSPYPTWISDTQGTMIRANPALKTTINLSEEQLINNYNVFQDKQIEPHIIQLVKEALEEGKTNHYELDWSGEKTEIENLEGGNRIFCEGTIFPIQNQSGEITNAVITYKDVTDKKVAEESLKAKEIQLLQSQKMETVGILAGGVAHEFNNLLYIILSTAELLMMDSKPEEGELLNEIVKTTQRGASLVKQLQVFSRKSEMHLYLTQLNIEIQKTKKMLIRVLPPMVNIQLDLLNDLHLINADKVQIEQVILNLCLNAKDAMPDGGTITIKTEKGIINKSSNDKHAEMPESLTEGKCVILTISDTGSGIEKKYMEHIFDPFFTTKDVGKGTGLGLAVIYGIIEGHGGYISCESEPGKGTAFKIYFPAVSDTHKLLSSSNNQDELMLQGTETILFVDDEKRIINNIVALFKRSGYTTLSANSGESALEVYMNNKIDLVVLDLGMPGMGGKKCLEKLIEYDKNVNVVVATGYLEEGSVIDIREMAKALVLKPFAGSEILRLVRDVLDK